MAFLLKRGDPQAVDHVRASFEYAEDPRQGYGDLYGPWFKYK